MTGPDPTHYIFWLASRAAGVTAFALASVSVIIGLAMAGKLSRRPGMAKRMRGLHEHAAIGALVAVAVHGLTLLGDRWMHPGLAGISVPFVMGYRPLATGIGILAGYLFALLGLSFYARRRIGARLWRKAHRLTIVVWLMAAVHTVTAGTDASTPWMQGVLAVFAAPIAVLFAIRMAAARRTAKRPARSSIGGPAAEAAR